jgi:hypothetical protein
VNSDYTEGFAGNPHNFNNVVPNRILDQHTNWWGYSVALGARVSPETPGAPAFCMDNPDLIAWVAAKMTNIAQAKPTACTYPLDASYFSHTFNLFPMDSTTFCQDPLCASNNIPPEPNPVPWATVYGGVSYSGSYYYFVNEVAKAVKQSGSSALVGALAYTDVFAPPTNITNFSDNVQVEVCLWGAPNLPMSDPANAGLKSAFDTWHTKCPRLATYDYALLHTDYSENDPRLPVPLILGTVDRAQYLASIGALDGGCQGNLGSLPYNPWNFYAYPRIRWNTNQTASQLETEFFNGYFREAAAPMLAYYQGLENYQVTNGINMHYKECCYGIVPGSFPLSVLAAMQTNLQAAELVATNWYVSARVADMRNGFDWLITNAGLYGVSLTNTALYPIIGSTTNPYTVNLTNMVKFMPSYLIGNFAYLQSGPIWWFGAMGQIQETFNVTKAGIYTTTITARGVEALADWPIMNVYFGPGNGSVSVNTTTNSTYNFTFTIPAGVWDLVITYNNAVTGGARNLIVSNIQITRQ